jgi:hypothetical protein
MRRMAAEKIFPKKIFCAGELATFAITILCFVSFACSDLPRSQPASQTEKKSAPPSNATPDASLQSLYSHIWRITKSPSAPAAGSIYVFLPNGTLLETSCTETYRIATWTIDKASPRGLRVVEDRQMAFTASIVELTDAGLRLEKNLVRSKEKQDVTYSAVGSEYVCPDMPR